MHIPSTLAYSHRQLAASINCEIRKKKSQFGQLKLITTKQLNIIPTREQTTNNLPYLELVFIRWIHIMLSQFVEHLK